MKISDIKIGNVPLYLQPKKHPIVKDPPRYPKVINGYENIAKRFFHKSLESMLKGLTVRIVEEVK